jgi:Flp pilus assembly protein CpaB
MQNRPADVAVSDAVSVAVDAAHPAKYRGNPFLSRVIAPGMRAVTVRVTPAGAKNR